MRYQIRLPLSVDHARKKMRVVQVPYDLYLQTVDQTWFQALLPQDIRAVVQAAKKNFERDNQFLSTDYQADYERAPYVRLLMGPQVHKAVVKMLSVNYQAHKDWLDRPAGSFADYFGTLDLFWKPDALVPHMSAHTQDRSREVVFFLLTLKDQSARITERATLLEKADAAARDEIARLRQTLDATERRQTDLDAEVTDLKDALQKAETARMILVPSDPIHMLGLPEDSNADTIQTRAKSLLKSLHPDKSGTPDTAFLFDLIVKARDNALKSV